MKRASDVLGDDDAIDKKVRSIVSLPTIRNGEQVNWSIRFSQGSTFKTFIENIASVMMETTFLVVNTKDYAGLVVESIDHARISMLQARISGMVSAPEGDSIAFCIRMGPILSFLRNISASMFVELWNPVDSTDIVLRLFEPRVGTHAPLCRLKTLAKITDACQLDAMTFCIYIEIDLHTFRSSIKTAREHHAEAINISVYSPKDQKGNVRTHFFVIAYEGEEVSTRFPFQSAVEITEEEEEEPSVMMIRANEGSCKEYDDLPAEHELNTLYTGRFSVDPISNFIKSLDRTTITIRLGNSKPILLDYSLGSGTSAREGDYIRLVCAPREQ